MLGVLRGFLGIVAQTDRYGDPEIPGPPLVELIEMLPTVPLLGGMFAVLLFHIAGPFDDEKRNAYLGSPPRVLLATFLAMLPGGFTGGLASRAASALTDDSWGTLEAVIFILASGVGGAWAIHLAYRFENKPR